MARRKTNEEFIKEVYDLVKDEYIFLEEYTNSATKIKCKHNTCGYEWSVRPNSFLNKGVRCPKCAKELTANKSRKTNKEFIEEVHSKEGNEYAFLEEYIGSQTAIKCKHNKCGYIWMVTPGNFLRGTRCPSCFGGILKTNEKFTKEVFDLVGNEYIFLEEYINTKTKIQCKHNKCDYVWKIRPNDFLQGTRCPQCNRPNYHRDTEQFEREVYELVGDEYTLIGEYIGALTKATFKHNECGHTWNILPSNFFQGNRCPQCNSSKGEQVIRRYLTNNHINFQQEYSFDDLTGLAGSPLRYDFAIFNNASNSLLFLIEYDGEFHFKEYYESQNFETLQIHDQRKNQYCKDNNIPLIRIPYWKFDNIEKILKSQII